MLLWFNACCVVTALGSLPPHSLWLSLWEVRSTGDQRKCTFVSRISLGLNISGNIWDNASTQLNKIYNRDLKYPSETKRDSHSWTNHQNELKKKKLCFVTCCVTFQLIETTEKRGFRRPDFQLEVRVRIPVGVRWDAAQCDPLTEAAQCF